MKKLLIILTMLMAATVNNNAQNIVVDQLDTPHYSTFYDNNIGAEITMRDNDTLRVVFTKPFTLDPNKTIIENYRTIDSIGQLYARDRYEYIFPFQTTYHNKNGDGYTTTVGYIKNTTKTTIGGQIIELLTSLYSSSLGQPFNVLEKDMTKLAVIVTPIDKETGVKYKDQYGNVIKEYSTEFEIRSSFMLYKLCPGTELHKKIYYDVMEETGLIEDTDHPTKTALEYVARNKYETWKYKDELKKKLRRYRIE